MSTLFRHGGGGVPGEMSYILINTATFPCEQLQLAFHTYRSKEAFVYSKHMLQGSEKVQYLLKFIVEGREIRQHMSNPQFVTSVSIRELTQELMSAHLLGFS
jgi:hypothetical protein